MGNSSEEQKARWDRKYTDGLPMLTEPDPFFISAYEKFVVQSFPEAGTALDLAGGIGRHALWLASRGWQVTVVDVSDVAIARLSRSAQELGKKLELLVADASEYEFEPVRFDLILFFFHLDRSLFPKLASALKTGGLLVCKMRLRWISDALAGPVPLNTDPLKRDEMPSLVPEMQVLYHRERPLHGRGVVEFVAKK